jgi:septum site-determining protein MinC
VTIEARTRPTIRFRGRSFLAMMLAPEPPLEDWLKELDALVERSPGFFAGRAVVLDLAAMPSDKQESAKLLAALSSRNIRVMAIEGRAPEELGPDMPPGISGGREARAIEPEARAIEPEARGSREAPAAQPRSSLLLDRPVRSGESVAFPQGDITILGSVGWGAELVAGGSIHVYGTLRGRAIAGLQGNAEARIFCRRLEAELLAIDGFYLTAEDMDPALRGRAAQARLTNQAVKMTALD